MSCGRPSEYIGPQNKPDYCSCGASFAPNVVASEPQKRNPLKTVGNKIIVGDMKLEKNFLLNLINIEFEEDSK